MATLIAQQDFIEDLFIQCGNCPDCTDFNTFLKDDFFGYDLICDFKNAEAFYNASIDNPIFEMLLDKVQEVKCSQNLEYELESDIFYKNLGEQNIFLTNKSNIECETLSKKRGYIFFSIENLSRNWQKIKKLKNSFDYKVTNSEIISEEDRFDSWSKINNFSFPITCIVIFDKYILGDKVNQKLKDNLLPLLLNLTKQNSRNRSLEITIISEFKATDKIESIHLRISRFLKNNEVTSFKLNIIKYVVAFYPSSRDKLHGRTIYTNYIHYRCDDSYNFFKENHKVNNDAELKIRFNLTKKNNSFYYKELNDIKYYLSKISNNQASPNENHKQMFYPDKSNSLFLID